MVSLHAPCGIVSRLPKVLLAVVPVALTLLPCVLTLPHAAGEALQENVIGGNPLEIVNDIIFKLEEARVQADVDTDTENGPRTYVSDGWKTDEQFAAFTTWMKQVQQRAAGMRAGTVRGETFEPELMALEGAHWKSLTRIVEALQAGRSVGKGFVHTTQALAQQHTDDAALWRMFAAAKHDERRPSGHSARGWSTRSGGEEGSRRSKHDRQRRRGGGGARERGLKLLSLSRAAGGREQRARGGRERSRHPRPSRESSRSHAGREHRTRERGGEEGSRLGTREWGKERGRAREDGRERRERRVGQDSRTATPRRAAVGAAADTKRAPKTEL